MGARIVVTSALRRILKQQKRQEVADHFTAFCPAANQTQSEERLAEHTPGLPRRWQTWTLCLKMSRSSMVSRVCALQVHLSLCPVACSGSSPPWPDPSVVVTAADHDSEEEEMHERYVHVSRAYCSYCRMHSPRARIVHRVVANRCTILKTSSLRTRLTRACFGLMPQAGRQRVHGSAASAKGQRVH